MGRFIAGFVVASVVWAGLGYAHVKGFIDLGIDPPVEEVLVEETPAEDDGAAPTDTRKRRKRVDRQARSGARRAGDATAGDDLRESDARQIDVAGGGEEQLTGSEIEAGFDSVFGKVRRCLMLVADDEPVTGKIIFGMRIAGTGTVTAVNLKGPAAVTATEAGSCMRAAAKSIRFRAFNGPEMLVHFPLTLE